MKTVFVLLALILVTGLCIKTYNLKIRLLLIGLIVAMLVYTTIV